MVQSKRTLHPSLQLQQAPSDVFMNFDAFVSNTETRTHSHPWGQLQIITGGCLAIEAQETRFLAPPHLAIWIPSQVMHRSYNRKPLDYCSINITSTLAERLPCRVSLMKVTPIMLAIIEDFRLRDICVANNETDTRLVQVLLDQLTQQPIQQHFLPLSQHKYLTPILSAIEDNPLDPRSLVDWADYVHTTERTLARYCQSELGMSFTEWRLRVRYLYSMELLREGCSVKEVALTLGYNQASPFIALFKKYSGLTPEQYKSKIHS